MSEPGRNVGAAPRPVVEPRLLVHRRGALLAVAVPLVLLQLLVMAPLVAGRDTLYLRDVLNTHLTMKAGQAVGLRAGQLRVTDPLRAGGQPLTGNPNALPFYPDDLLYLVASPLWALNAHFWLHFLLAPWSFAWLGRRFRLGAPAALAGGGVYALSGFFLSQMSYYNLIAGAALVPALLAACLGALEERRWSPSVAGVVWALLLLAGDPLTAAAGLALAMVLVAVWPLRPKAGETGAPRRGPALGRLALALALGTVVAAPQLVELWRILPASYRGFHGFTLAERTLGSWHPVQSLGWLVPFFFGRFDRLGLDGFWGARWFTGALPYYVTLYPGLLALALAAAAGWRGGRGRRLAWGAVALGLFVALGRFNPLLAPLFALPGAAVLRFPVRAFLLVALGLALLAAIAFEEGVLGAEAAVQGRLRRALLALAALLGVLLGLARLPHGGPLARLLPTARPGLAAVAAARWSTFAAVGILVLMLAVLLVALARRRPVLAATGLVALHVGSQLLLLQPALAMDRTFPYQEPPPLLRVLPPGTRVAQSATGDLFGTSALLGARYPDDRAFWLARRAAFEVYPFMGVRWGLRYELDLAPEGLDSYLGWLARDAVRQLPDRQRVALLRTWAVEAILPARPLAADALPLVRLLARERSFGSDSYVYAIADPLAPVRWVGGVMPAADPRAALDALLAPGFDPTTAAVLAGDAAPLPPRSGIARVLVAAPESFTLTTDEPVPGVVVVDRDWLPVWRARVDGRPATIEVANLHRLGVRVPAGSHRVELAVDHGPLDAALAAAGCALLALAVLALLPRRRSGAASSPR